MNIDGSTGNKYAPPTITRPYDFGTDAIERQRVSTASSLIDADFEYGLQATKWQTYSDIRKIPSFYDIPGTELNNPNYPAYITTNASSPSCNLYIQGVANTTIQSAASVSTSAAILTVNSGSNVAIGQGVFVQGLNFIGNISPSVSTVAGTSVTIVYPTQPSAPSFAGNPPVNFFSTVYPLTSNAISIYGLANSTNDANRGEGFSLLSSVAAVGTGSATGQPNIPFLNLGFQSKIGNITPPYSALGNTTATAGSPGTLTFNSITTPLPLGTPIVLGGTVSGATMTIGDTAVLISPGQIYFVAGTSTATTCQLSETVGGPALKFTNTNLGSITFTPGAVSTSYTTIRRAAIFANSSNVSYANSFCIIATSLASQNGADVTVTTQQNHGLVAGVPITTIGTGADGNYIIKTVASATTFIYTIAGSVTQANFANGTAQIYVQPYSYVVHRPFDGGVLLSPNIPCWGASASRQSKKVFRYQSGKGLLWSSGTLFCPNNDIVSVTAAGTTITVITAIPHGSPQLGATVQLRGITSAGYNGNYTVTSVTNANQLTVTAAVAPVATTAILGDQPRFIMSRWHGASIRAGCFDDQNGLFWEFDGQTLWVVKRSSTFQIAGFVSPTLNSQLITGVGTRFSAQLRINDRVVIRGMTYCVTSISSDTVMTVNPPWRAQNQYIGLTCCKVKEVRTPQSQFNRDTLDGRGASGFNVDLSKMQMIGIQYTWYGAGFIDFMMRGGDGNWVYAHRYKQNNINDESYMRTGNMPVRYEIITETSHAVSTLAQNIGSGDMSITLNDPLTYWPSTGTVLIDQEQITYSGISGQTLTGLTRSATLNYNVGDASRILSGSSAAAHNINGTVNLISCTCAPSLTHWGSAFLMDGGFDQDRGYFFNYQYNNGTLSLASGGIINLFMLRLSPCVSNGIIGDLGTRDLLNRAQLLLQKIDLYCGGSAFANAGMVVTGILNPSGLIPTTWSAINSPQNGSQPSFAQVATTFTGNYVVGSGERIFSTISNAGQNTLDLTNLKEICNGVIGGNNMFPDGPDTLLVQVAVPSGAAFSTLSAISINLFWSEAQA
jgi:hypothetical protein